MSFEFACNLVYQSMERTIPVAQSVEAKRQFVGMVNKTRLGLERLHPRFDNEIRMISLSCFSLHLSEQSGRKRHAE